jgi:transposase-like protein
MNNRKTYTGDYKAKVVLECIRGEKSLIELSEQYAVHPNQIKNWKSYFLKKAACIFEDKRKKRKPKNTS